MSRLFAFLENFDINCNIRIYSENSELIFERIIGDVPQKVTQASYTYCE